MTTFACGQCGAAVTASGTCPYCASPLVVSDEGGVAATFVVPFAFDEARAQRGLARWLRGRSPFVDKRVRLAELRGVYAPAYLYSAVAHTTYTAAIGERYSETEEYTEFENFQQVKKTRTHARTEHRPLAGRHVGYVTDVLVTASATLPVGDYDLRQLRRYDPAFVAGWVTEAFRQPREGCLAASHRAAIDQVGDALRRFMPGDSYSDLDWKTRVEWESLDPLYVPVYVAALRHRDRTLRVVINGQTGETSGSLPILWWRVVAALLVVAALAVLVTRAV